MQLCNITRPLTFHNGRSLARPVSRSFVSNQNLARHPSPSAHKWSHPPSSTNIADDEVASLAGKPLHALSLADLVRSVLCATMDQYHLLTVISKTRPSTAFSRGLVLLRELHPLPSANSSSTQNPGSAKFAIHCCLESEHLKDLQ